MTVLAGVAVAVADVPAQDAPAVIVVVAAVGMVLAAGLPAVHFQRVNRRRLQDSSTGRRKCAL